MLSIKNKTIQVLLISSALFCFSNIANAVELTGCAAKKEDINHQIKMAQMHNNEHRVLGLMEALKETEANCTEDALLQKRLKNITDKQQKVDQRLAELKETQNSGRLDKIQKKQRKLDAAKDELAIAKAELNR